MPFTPVSAIATRNVVTLSAQHRVSDAVNLMAERGMRDVIVTGCEDLRIITTQIAISLRLLGVGFETPLADAGLPRVGCLDPDCNVTDALVALQGSVTEHLCLIDAQQALVGIVSYTDLINHLDPLKLAERRCIRDLLSLADYATVLPDVTLEKAMLQMHAAGHSAALIPMQDDAFGILTQSDITRALSHDENLSQPVGRFMSFPALTVSDDLSLQEAVRISRARHHKRLVVRNALGQVVGLLHQKELVALIYQGWSEQLHRHEAQLQAALENQQSDVHWRAVLESTQTGVWDWNAKTDKVYFSSAWKAMLGYAEDEIGDCLEEWSSRIHPDDKEAVFADLERHFSGKTALYENTHRMRCKDGGYKWILDRGKVFSVDAEGKPLRVIGTHTDVTEGYEQRQRLEQLAANTPGVLYQYRLFPDGRSCFPYATPGMQDVYGFTPVEVRDDATPVLERLHPLDHARIQDSIAESAQTLQVWDTQYRYLHPLKGERWVEGRATPRRIADGSVIWNGYIYDITERKLQELQLQDISTRLQLTMEATDTGLWSWDLLSNAVLWSAQTYRQIGYPPDAFPVSLTRFQQLMHPEDRAAALNEVMQCLEQGKGFLIQFRLRHADGHWVWIQGRGKVTVSDEQGKPTFMMGTHIDISNLKQKEIELLDSELRLSQLAAHSRTVIWEVDTRGLYSFVSPVCELVWGYRSEELVGVKHFYDLHPEAGREAFKETALSIIASGQVIDSFENPVQHRNGQIIWVTTNGFPLRSASGDVVGYQGSDRDITDQKLAEEAIKAAQRSAEESNRAKSRFLANMSHEIRTPMNGIIGLSELSVHEQDTGVLHDRLHKINQSGRMLLGIINDVLDFSKIEAGKLEIDPQPFVLSDLLDNLSGLFAQMAGSKRLALRIHADTQLAPVFVGDELRLRQVLTNLLGNAIKFTDAGAVELTVRQPLDRVGLIFSIRDSGIGISPEQQARLFSAFSQADSSITRRHGGSGLGLAISQRLVAAMGGEGIELESEPGRGSCFSFMLPLPEGLPDQTQALLQRHTPVEELRVQLAGQVLLVEDHKINQEVALTQLRQLGLTVDLAENGAEALKKLAIRNFDLVLMDIQMPVMDGYEATRRLRAQGHVLPVIALTAAAMIEDQNEALACGMNDHLGKPIDTQGLQRVLAKWLPQERLSGAPASEGSNAVESGSPVIFDQTAGLRLLGGDLALQRKLIAGFLLEHQVEAPAMIAQIRALKDSSTHGQLESLRRAVHSLKGVAGNLALRRLSAAAGRLDHALKMQMCPDSTLCRAFEHDLQATLRTIEQWLDETRLNVSPLQSLAFEGTPVPSREAILEQLLSVQSAVLNCEFIEEARLQLLERLLPVMFVHEWRGICGLLSEFDFEPAAQRLASLIDLIRVECS